MDIKHLTTFLVVYKTGSFSRAAQILGYAQPTVTLHIHSLEEELQVKLFERLGHKIKITGQGERLLYYAEKIRSFSAEAIAEFKDEKELPGKITIGANQSFTVTRMPLLLKAFMKRHPHIELSLKFGSLQEIHKQICENLIDVAFFLTKKVKYSDLIVETLREEPVVAVIALNHSWKNYPSVGIQDFAGETLIITQKNCTYRAMIDEMLRTAGIQPRSLIEINNVQAIKELVMSGMGITVLPRISVKDELERGLLLEVPWDGTPEKVFTQIAYHKGKWLSPVLTNFLTETRLNYSLF